MGLGEAGVEIGLHLDSLGGRQVRKGAGVCSRQGHIANSYEDREFEPVCP